MYFSYPALICLMYYTYCLKNKYDNELYYVYTSDLARRCREHGKNWKLVYYEAYLSEYDARERERKLKDYGQARAHLKKRMKNSLDGK
jgi:predicted GIY-YIG superfamily endonuclease